MYEISTETAEKVKHYSRLQFLFFVMSSRAKNAVVVDADISLEAARREARRIGGCIRRGRVIGGMACTM